MAHELQCEVVFSPAPQVVTRCICQISIETTLLQAIHASGILQQHAEIDLTVMRVGVYGKLRKLDDLVKAGDRIEIYRPLRADPKNSRRLRAKKQRLLESSQR